MKTLLIPIFLCLVGCGTFATKPDVTTAQVIPEDATNGTGINPYKVTAFPVPQQAITPCITGNVVEIITGNEATTIWYKPTTISGLNTIRLPHTHPVKIKIVDGGFCYDYFDVTMKIN